MRVLRSVCVVVVLAVILGAVLLVGAFAADSDKYKPTPPPKIPAADFESGGRKYLDFTILYADMDVVTLRAGGVGFNYVGMIGDQVGWNVGAGLFYLTGEDDDKTMDITGGIIPLTANIAYRPYNVPGGNSLILFAGLHYSWTGIYVDIEPSTEVDVSLTTYGPMFGAKARIMITPTVAFIPYYVFKYDNYDAEINVDGTVSNLDIDPAAVHIIGFDIEIGAISVGAMLDMLNNANRDMIMISFTYNLDYEESKAPSAPAPKAPQRGRAGK